MSLKFVYATLMCCLLFGCSAPELTLLDRKPEEARAIKTVDLRIPDYCATDFTHVELFVSNLSYIYSKNSFLIDDDWDGLPNISDSSVELNLRLDRQDSNRDGYPDLLMFMSGIDTAAQDLLPLCVTPTLDTDGDGISDCGEALVGTDAESVDTDNDTIPDFLELRMGMNPKDALDAPQDRDGDSVTNLQEVKFNSPIRESNLEGAEKFRLNYEHERKEDGCVQFDVTRIPVVETTEDNLLWIYFVQRDSNQERRFMKAQLSIPTTAEQDELFELSYKGIIE